MFRPRATTRFRKDLKQHVSNDVELLLAVTRVMHQIVDGEKLPTSLRPHKLSGEYEDCWECHVLADLLLIWIPDARSKVVTFVRLGSHSELFG
jgi:mRNA interferase YafQ